MRICAYVFVCAHMLVCVCMFVRVSRLCMLCVRACSCTRPDLRQVNPAFPRSPESPVPSLHLSIPPLSSPPLPALLFILPGSLMRAKERKLTARFLRGTAALNAMLADEAESFNCLSLPLHLSLYLSVLLSLSIALPRSLSV